MASTAVDFYNELRLIWDIVLEVGIESVQPGQGFPSGFEYRWAENKNMTPVTCSGPQYVDHVLNWVERETSNEEIFPTSAGEFYSLMPAFLTIITSNPLSTHFSKYCKDYLYKILQIICHHLYPSLHQIGTCGWGLSFKYIVQTFPILYLGIRSRCEY